MCGRYVLYSDRRALREFTGCDIPENFRPSYNIAPGETVPAIVPVVPGISGSGVADPGKRRAALLPWGLSMEKNRLINARLETADTLPRFRDSWTRRRCLLPANGFYEWVKTGEVKQPYYFHPPDHGLFFFAGLRVPGGTNDGTEVCLIVTTAARPPVQSIHSRMPVILPAPAGDDWLAATLQKETVAAHAETTELHCHPVSRRVNATRNKESDLIQAMAPSSDNQMSLF